MKKFLALTISLILVMLSVADGVVVAASIVPQSDELEAFASELSQLVRTHDQKNSNVSNEYEEGDSTAESDAILDYFPIQYQQEFFTNNSDNRKVESDELDNILKDYDLSADAFESKRLIVKSYSEIDYQGAIDCVSGYKDLYILQYSSVIEAISAYQYYLSCSNIEYVEPDYIASVQAEVSDSSILDGDSSEYYYELVDKVESWNTEEIGYDAIKDELAQKKLADVLVAVLDSGVDTDHELLEGRLIESTVNLSSTGEENSCEDDYGHGTHVAGIVVDNSLSNVMVKPYKVLNNRGRGSVSLISIAIDMAVADGADIINLSLTSEGESQTMTDSVNAATEQNINVVAAAGNNRADLSKTYYTPACIDSAITVSATTKDYKLASYSSYNGPIDIAAPGDDIKSSYLNNTYALLDGTSMSAPQVTAGLAIVKSVYPELTSEQVEEKIEEYAIKMAEYEGENYFGAGVLYLKYILSTIPRTTEPVFNVLDGEFSSSFKLTISCPEEDATILYVIHDGKNVENIGYLTGTQYLEPITISVNTKISAVAISKGKLFSAIVTHEYIRSDKTEADKFDIDSKGMITGYFGNEIDLVVPEVIQGITVKGIGNSAFKDNSKIRSVVLPDTATVIDSYAFSGCTSIEKVSGNGITQVKSYAFSMSTLSQFPFEQLTSIGASAFSGCNNLENVRLVNAISIGKSAFENARNITELHSSSIKSLGQAAFRGTNLISVVLPNITNIEKNAFESCTELVSVSGENVTTISSNGFSDCISLNILDLPQLKTLGTYAFRNTAIRYIAIDTVENIDNYAFTGCTLLKMAVFPNATQIGSYAFSKCTALKFIYFPVLAQLNNSTFSQCESLKSVWLPSVVTVNSWAFNNSYIEYVQLDSVQKIYSLPSTLQGIVLPTSFSSVNVTTPETDYVVYGFEGTYAEQYAADTQKEFQAIPSIVRENSDGVNVDEKYIFSYALGFDLKYQWYKNDTLSNENGTLIEGATNFWYEPTREDNAVCYYCVIESGDGTSYNKAVTSPIKNALEYQEADYTAYNELIESIAEIDRDLYTEESLAILDALLNEDISGYSLAEQELIDNTISDIKNAISSLIFDYLLGDINDDGKISVLDARLALKAVSETTVLEKLQSLSADVNGDGKISLVDVRIILRVASGALESIE